MDPNLILIIGIAAVIVIILGAIWFSRKRRTDQLRDQFGPEYERTVKEVGDRGKAEQALAERERRVHKLEIRELSPEERDRFVALWSKLQAEFVDDPGAAVGRSDALLSDVMATRGYPVRNFDEAADDVSVDHPRVVEHYRAAHDVALRHERGEAGTEDLRRAMIHYRELFSELVGEVPPEAVSETREETTHGR